MRKEEEDGRRVVAYWKLFSYADSLDYGLMGVGSICAVGNGLCMPVMTIFFGQLVDSIGKSVTTATAVHDVTQVSLKFLYLAVASAVVSFLQVASWMVTGERQAARIRSLYLKTILRQDISYFDDVITGGEVIGRMSGDTILIRDAIGEKVGSFIQQVAAFTGGFVVALVRGWLLTFVLLSSIPPLFISGAILHKVAGSFASRGQASYSTAATIAEQTIGSIRTVASFAGEKQAIATYNQSLSKAYKWGVRESVVSGVGFGTLMCILFSSYGFAFWYGGKMMLDKGYTAGTVINVIFAVVISSLNLGLASTCLTAFAAGQAAAFKMFQVIQRKPKIDVYSPKGRKKGDISGQIELRDVYFSYPARPKELILKGFSLFIPSGKTAALVGRSGSGKSTVISLIERFYDPMTGEVLIDGVDLRKLQLKWIRRKIGLVSQEPVLFGSRSIRENIAYGREGASSEDVIAAAVLANAADFISKLPQGLDTMVGEQGIQLSGGQKQRIAIARAILKNPRILLLDEATSALDGESERIVQGALERAMLNRTVIVVSHRLSTVMNAHFIAVIHRGRIVQKGSHAELLKDRKGLYNQLLRLQDIGKEMKRDISVHDSLEIGPQSLSAPHRHFLHTTKSQEAMPELPSKSEASDKGPPQVPLCRLARLNSPEIPVLLLGALLAVANGVILPIFGTVLSGIIKTFSEPPQELSKDSKFWALMFVVLGFASFLSHSLSTYFFAIAGCKLIQRVRSMCFEKVVNMDIGWFDDPQHSSGAIGTRLSTDAVLVRRVVGDSLAILAQSTATAVAGLVIAFQANWQLALAILALLPLIGISGYGQLKSMKGFTANAKKMYEEANQVANEAVGSMRTVASFCAEKKVVKQYEKKCEAPLKAGIRHGLISGIGLGMSSFFLFFAYAISFYVGALVVHHGKATFHQVFFALSVTAIGISQSNSLAPDTSKAKVSVASIFEILDQRSKIDPSQNCGKRSKHVKGDIQFRHVRFKYPSRPDIKIFRDLCLTIRAGMTVALVGESGSGKSTFISLLQRFYEPDAGRITLDGIEISKLQLKWLRQQMGLVSQEPVLFNDTIRANIAYGKAGNVTEAEIVAAAKLANAHNFISSLQQGYNAVVGERGINLSGGQKQRVAIARAVIRAPKILLLDEATSALDAECERAVQEALERVMVGRTTVVVSHRLSTIKGVDLIAVIRNGVIVEKGRHETLIKIKDGFYTSLMAPRNKM
ncbi:hypothetical protein Goshw_006637 [Gossypium schwendimanii]|uniref:Uncharacterized protein n=1 Tax=Gossypium schwendimanii TaxID=34291 RepID=A0A7J9MGE4_GOSSC|nr:hypothetical protein [Gossypium schwendimanii]